MRKQQTLMADKSNIAHKGMNIKKELDLMKEEIKKIPPANNSSKKTLIPSERSLERKNISGSLCRKKAKLKNPLKSKRTQKTKVIKRGTSKDNEHKGNQAVDEAIQSVPSVPIPYRPPIINSYPQPVWNVNIQYGDKYRARCPVIVLPMPIFRSFMPPLNNQIPFLPQPDNQFPTRIGKL